MKDLKLYSKRQLENLIDKREGEIKFGEKVQTVETLETLENKTAKYVLFGIPEDVGVHANYGKKGTSAAWEQCLKSLLNMQANTYTNAENLLVLGEVDCSEQMRTASLLAQDGANFGSVIGKLVEEIDVKVSQVVRAIISAGKIPIIIGGGHNNAFGNLKGASEGTGGPINVVNFDAHTDFRPLEHRHSGNGFSYAMERGYIDKYVVFGLHKTYTSQEVYNRMEQFKNKIAFFFFEDIQLRENPTFKNAVSMAHKFLLPKKYGVELDVDAIENFPSSAMSPSGFTMKQARQFLRFFVRHPHVAYVHICEAVPHKNPDLNYNVGKALAYFVSDVISD
ncbi:formimidoylglutamase [Patiriisocius hiemis]|uniref:Formimidoylglutamase n=1 Tax=Patiriisocius hiemis TaxID=3075604 RepID=A0ABU2Y8C2_9FLAO|nr:formimidoylglutamase [Constantimarinum sp. W242]MDT0554433.1 formimidoylglutamase [Constantimarinum sp. W242]